MEASGVLTSMEPDSWAHAVGLAWSATLAFERETPFGTPGNGLIVRVEDCPGFLDFARVVQVQNMNDSPASALLLCLE